MNAAPPSQFPNSPLPEHRDASSSASRAAASPNESELDYLNDKLASAQADIVRDLSELRTRLSDAVDLRQWATHYPWATVGLAAAVGFSAATVVTPRKGETIGDKLSELGGMAARRREATRTEATARQATAAADATPQTARPILQTTLITALFDLAKVVLQRGMQAPPAAAPAGPPPPVESVATATTANTPTQPRATDSAGFKPDIPIMPT